MDDAAGSLDHAFQALSDRNRRAILSIVRDQPRAVGQIAEALGLSQQTTSHHLKVLRAADLVTSSRDGTRQLYAIRSDGLATTRAYLEDFWPQHLRALKRAAEAASAPRSADGTTAAGGSDDLDRDEEGESGG